MNIRDLSKSFEQSADDFSSSFSSYLADSGLSSELKDVLDELSRQSFYALRETQKSLIQYLEER